MTLGASNVSFGMPDRHAIGAAFLPMAISAGLTSAIMDARSPQIVRAVKAADLLLDRDAWGAAWIARPRGAAAGGRPRRDGPTAPGQRTCPRGARPGRTPTAGPGPRPVRVDLVFEPARGGCGCRTGVTMFDAASWNGIAIDSTCGGHGTCKKCTGQVGRRRRR